MQETVEFEVGSVDRENSVGLEKALREKIRSVKC